MKGTWTNRAMRTAKAHSFLVMLAVALASLLVASAYAGAASPADSEFAVSSTDPVDGATNVAVGANIIVKFNRSIEPKTVTVDTVLVNGRPLREMQDGAVVFPEEGSCVVLFRPSRGSTYKITLTTGVKDASGTPLAKPYVWSFATESGVGSSGTPLRVFARYPRLNDMRVPTNAPITMVFTGELDTASVSDESVLAVPTPDGKAVPGKVTAEGMRMVFRPAEPLKPRRTYEVQLAPGIKSKSGDMSENTPSWQFTTGEAPAEGPIVTDCWYESYTSLEGIGLVFHAAVENLVKPAKISKPDKTDEPADVNKGVLLAGHTMKVVIVSLNGLVPDQPLSTPTSISASDMPISNGSPSTVVQAAYTHGGGSGQGNSVGGSSDKDPAMEGVMAAIDAALASDKAVVLQDSGDTINSGDQTKSDGIYSARLSLDKAFPSGQAFIAFSIAMPDGKRTQPVTTAFYVMPKSAEAAPPTTSQK